jgi:hypothetical protein
LIDSCNSCNSCGISAHSDSFSSLGVYLESNHRDEDASFHLMKLLSWSGFGSASIFVNLKAYDNLAFISTTLSHNFEIMVELIPADGGKSTCQIRAAGFTLGH